MPVLTPGDILLTRNADERQNTTPGYWNHSALYIGRGLMVEAQRGQGVIISQADEFLKRYPQILVMRPLRLCSHKQRTMTTMAWHLVGRPYNEARSIWFLFYDFHRGYNCVSVVRSAYSCAYGFDPGWTLPDDLARDRWHLYPVGSKGLK